MPAVTTIAVDLGTKQILDLFKRKLECKTYDETILELAKSKNALLLDEIFGIAPKLPKFKREEMDFDRNIG